MKNKYALLIEIKSELIEIRESLTLVHQWLGKEKKNTRDELWTVEQVAEYLHKSKGTIQSHYQGKPGFPRSKRIGNKQYWIPQEVVTFARKRESY